ncbi:MAG: NAD(P)H-hydrate dehydratase [Bacteroidales bacterium]|nr:NAD(P)H-hydrate dehydratase [Bacteroidales bacterium]
MLLPEYLTNRRQESHKGDYGHALLVAGSYGKMGAAVLAAKACLRAGAGLLTAHVPLLGVDVMQSSFPEAMVDIDGNDGFFGTVPTGLEKYAAVAVGPGLGMNEVSCQALKELLRNLPRDKFLIMDADALNLLATHSADLLPLLPYGTILTPHEREFERLVSGKYNPPSPFFGNEEQRLQTQWKFAAEYKVVVIRKTHRSMVVSPDGRVSRNDTGNAGMSTAGAGDVLTGIILGLAAQERCYSQGTLTSKAEQAYNIARIGTALHGLAGDLAAQRVGQPSLIASDIIDTLPEAIRKMHTDSCTEHE